MKNYQIITSIFCLSILMACSSAKYSYRINSSSFDAEETLADQGNLSGAPVGDTYETEGNVTASFGTVSLSSPTEDSQLELIGRTLDSGETPFAVIIQLDSQYLGIPGASSPASTFTVRDQEGTIGLSFTVSGDALSIDGFGTIDMLTHPADGSSIEFQGISWHKISIQINFETKRGKLSLGQDALAASVDFTIPGQFGIAQSLMIQVPAIANLSHRIREPFASYLKH